MSHINSKILDAAEARVKATNDKAAVIAAKAGAKVATEEHKIASKVLKQLIADHAHASRALMQAHAGAHKTATKRVEEAAKDVAKAAKAVEKLTPITSPKAVGSAPAPTLSPPSMLAGAVLTKPQRSKAQAPQAAA